MLCNQEWLDGLKAGDKVVVKEQGGLSLGTVVRVTPKRQIVVSCRGCEERFNRNGVRREADSWFGAYLVEPTPALMEEVHLQRLERTARGLVGRIEVPRGDVKRLAALIEAIRPFVPEKKEG